MENNFQPFLEEQLNKYSHEQIIVAAKNISLRYRTREKDANAHFIQSPAEALAYAAARMPATYGAVAAALAHTLESLGDVQLKTLIDVGAGTGAATWATYGLLELASVLCLEYDDNMKTIGQALMKNDSRLKNAEWRKLDISSEALTSKSDLVIASYVMNELSPEKQLQAAKKLWDAASGVLLFIEAGTPQGYKTLKRIRQELCSIGAHIIAPCPHGEPCPLTENDWCHFACRIRRTKLHKLAKGGDAPYEDEKYSYLALSRTPAAKEGCRILRHPQIEKGYVKLELCGTNGLEQRTISKKNGETYKKARKAQSGDML